MARVMITILHEETFWKLGESQDNGCILWTGRVDDQGYGRMGPTLTGTTHAHRSAWILAYGPVPEEMTIDHTCHSESTCRRGSKCLHRRCINPEHLRLLTLKENIRLRRNQWDMKPTCPQGHPRRTLPGGQRYCPQCTSRAMMAWRAKGNNRDIDNIKRKLRKGPVIICTKIPWPEIIQTLKD